MSNKPKFFISLVKYRVWWLVLSAFLLLPGIIAMIYASSVNPYHLPLKVGIDYTGGTILQYGLTEKISNEDLSKTRVALQDIGIENPYLQILNVNTAQQDNTKANIQSIISIRTAFLEKDSDLPEKITEVLSSEYSSPELMQTSSVGPTLGKELFKNSLIAITLAFLGIIAYLTFRFRLDYALAAILGVVHDVIFVVGIFALLGIIYNFQID